MFTVIEVKEPSLVLWMSVFYTLGYVLRYIVVLIFWPVVISAGFSTETIGMG